MLEVIRSGENAVHDTNFDVNRPNGYPHYLLLLVRTTAHFKTDSGWITIKPNCVVIFRPNQPHRYHAADETYIDCWAHLRATQILPCEHFPFGVPIPLHDPDSIYSLFHLMNNEFYGVSPQRSMTLHYLGMALMNRIADEINSQERPELYYQLVSLRERIYNQPDTAWDIPSMANGLNISTGHLHLMYKHYFHTTCINDVIQSRLQSACDMLLSTTRPVSEIALLCGYQNTEHFIRQFKSMLHTTPGKYRRNKPIV